MDEKEKTALVLLLDTVAVLVAGNQLGLSEKLKAMKQDILSESPPAPAAAVTPPVASTAPATPETPAAK